MSTITNEDWFKSRFPEIYKIHQTASKKGFSTCVVLTDGSKGVATYKVNDVGEYNDELGVLWAYTKAKEAQAAVMHERDGVNVIKMISESLDVSRAYREGYSDGYDYGYNDACHEDEEEYDEDICDGDCANCPEGPAEGPKAEPKPKSENPDKIVIDLGDPLSLINAITTLRKSMMG